MESNGNLDDVSISKANGIILDALRGAGPVGLNIDDLLEVFGNFLQQKQISMRLNDLFIRDQIIKVPGNVWKIKIQNEPHQPSCDDVPRDFVQPNPLDLPSINLPGTPKFSSYKNSLQEYCQKMHGPVPSYRSKRDCTGIIGVVSVLSNTFEADVAAGNPKDADQRVAFAALKKLGYIPEKITFGASVNGGTKRSSSSSLEGTPAKQLCTSGFSSANSKSQKSALNELAQKNKLNAPEYQTVRTNNGFFTTVTFNGRQFKSSKSCAKKKDAEQDAATVALAMLTNNVGHTPPDVLTNDQKTECQKDVDEMIKSARAASDIKTSLKNRLQEYCQRMKKPFPEYTTDTTESSGHISTVTVEGKTFKGKECPGKKAAEMSAAQTVLIDLGLMAVVEGL